MDKSIRNKPKFNEKENKILKYNNFYSNLLLKIYLEYFI